MYIKLVVSFRRPLEAVGYLVCVVVVVSVVTLRYTADDLVGGCLAGHATTQYSCICTFIL